MMGLEDNLFRVIPRSCRKMPVGEVLNESCKAKSFSGNHEFQRGWFPCELVGMNLVTGTTDRKNCFDVLSEPFGG